LLLFKLRNKVEKKLTYTKNMKKLTCSSLGHEDCPFEATGESEGEVRGKIYEHAKEVHPEDLEGMNEEKKQILDDKMNAAITEE
jgi:predicted small metal-binding protein